MHYIVRIPKSLCPKTIMQFCVMSWKMKVKVVSRVFGHTRLLFPGLKSTVKQYRHKIHDTNLMIRKTIFVDFDMPNT